MKWKNYGKKKQPVKKLNTTPAENPPTEKKRNKQLERQLVRRPCVARWWEYIGLNQLNRYTFLQANFSLDFGKLDPKTRGLLKLDGYGKGIFDMTIIAGDSDITRVWLIEFKYDTDYTKEQKAIAKAVENTPITALKIHNVDDFDVFVRENLI